MARFLKQSTSATIRVGPVLDFGGTAVTSATLTAKLAKEGGALAARNDATAIAHDADGYFSVVLNATDTNTVGRLRLAITGSGLIPFNEDFVVLSGAVYDSLFGTTALSTLTAAGVRSELGTELGRIDAAITTRLSSASYVAAPSAAANATAVRSELATELGRIDAAVSSRLASGNVTVGGYAAGQDPWTLVAAGVVEGSTSFVQSARGWNSVLMAKASGLDTTTAVYRDLADSKARITATVDTNGNRTAVTRDLT